MLLAPGSSSLPSVVIKSRCDERFMNIVLEIRDAKPLTVMAFSRFTAGKVSLSNGVLVFI